VAGEGDATQYISKISKIASVSLIYHRYEKQQKNEFLEKKIKSILIHFLITLTRDTTDWGPGEDRTLYRGGCSPKKLASTSNRLSITKHKFDDKLYSFLDKF